MAEWNNRAHKPFRMISYYGGLCLQAGRALSPMRCQVLGNQTRIILRRQSDDTDASANMQNNTRNILTVFGRLTSDKTTIEILF